MQISHLALCIGLHHVFDFCHHRVVHLAVQQHFAGFQQQAFGPQRHQHGTDDAHHRVQPRPTEPPPTGQRQDGQHRGEGVGHYMQISGLQIQVVVTVCAVCPMFMGMAVARAVVMVMRPTQNDRADDVHQQAQHADHHRLWVLNRLG